MAGMTTSLDTSARLVAASNPFLLSGKGRSALLGEITLKPELAIDDGTGFSFDAGGNMTARGYSRSYGSLILGDVKATGKLRQGERMVLTASVGFERDAVIDALTDSVGGIADPRSIRNGITADAALRWQPGPSETIVPHVSFQRTSFGNSDILQDTRVIAGDISYDRRVSERTSLGARAAITASQSGPSRNFVTIALFTRAARELSPIVRANVEVGLENSHQTRSAGTRTGGLDRLALSGRGEVCADLERGSACVDASAASDISALGALQRRYSAGVTMTRRLQSGLSGSLLGRYQRAVSSGGGVRVPAIATGLVRASLDWRARQALTLSAQFEQRFRGTIDRRTIAGSYAGVQIKCRF